MLLTGILLFVLCLILSAFFSSSETAYIGVNPYSLEVREKKGSRPAGLARKIRARTNDLLATILIGNTLVNAAMASIATTLFVAVLPDEHRGRAAVYATAATTVLLLVFGELTPKTFAAHNAVRTASAYAYPLRASMFVLAPLARLFSFVTGLLMPSSKTGELGAFRPLNEEELRIALHAGTRGLSTLRRRIVSGAFEIGSRPVREIMVPRPEIKAVEIDSGRDAILSTLRSSPYSRYPVYRGRLDNIEGILHSKDIFGYLIDKKDFAIKDILRQAVFVPELAPLEKILLTMQERALHMALVVDEFGNVDGLVTLEDIIEEIVGEIRDEHDAQSEAWFSRLDGGRILVDGAAPVKEVNALVALDIPDSPDYTTLAGFFLSEFGRLPREKDSLEFGGFRLTVDKMIKRRIARIEIAPAPPPSAEP